MDWDNHEHNRIDRWSGAARAALASHDVGDDGRDRADRRADGARLSDSRLDAQRLARPAWSGWFGAAAYGVGVLLGGMV